MERYESLGLVGEGSYGTVLKCRHRDSGRLVAIKKFVDSDDDKTVKKIALREIRLLRQLRHSNLVNLLEVWKRRRRWYLVFEFVERTLLDDLEQNPSGLNLNTSRQYLYQILRAAAFCHQQNIIHRDIKPENILISHGDVVKLCDFGFARTVASPAEGGVYTDYVATRWYRAPELLVGDIKYGKPVDVWAIGCLSLEMLTGQPLFPGDSDLDQIYHIVRCFGNLTTHHQELFYRNPVFSGVKLPECHSQIPLQQRFPTITSTALDLAQSCLQVDPERRTQCSELLEHPLFTQDSFHIRFLNELNAKIQKDHRENSTLPKITKIPRRETVEGNEKNQRGKDKKLLEDVDEKAKKEKEKKEKKEEEKMEKTKGKQASKLSRTIRNTSEPFMSTKQSKTLGAKVINGAVKGSVAMQSKPEKVTSAGNTEKPKHHGGIYSRLAQQSLLSHITASIPAQVSDKSLNCERSFLSDRCNFGNSGGVSVAKKKSDIHFPDLRGSVLPELRGRDGKHNKSITKDLRKDKLPVPSMSPSEPQQHGHNSTARHHTHTS
ncbi:cyclin-dependent kinase-like 1 [Lates calcarifer]|uniref:Cyclin-dependent kinase-like 1 n=1 Tax=Lates calcarifer TaxID=8187 RepID=A0AAJ8DL38_LATCA|nr:cyclin-dependent kinase-like 1 [Lates calcarifer]